MPKFLAKNKNILISVGTNLLLVLLAIFVFGTRYATDDDIAMARIAYGTFFEPQARLVFSCTAFGFLLKALSSLIEGVNWQLILYYLFLLFGGIVSFYFILKKNKKVLTIVWLIVVTSFYYATYISINFSVVASMLAFFGYISLFVGAYEKEKLPVVLSSLILSFAMIVRFESFFAVSLFAFFAFVLVFIDLFKLEDAKTSVLRYVAVFAFVLAIPMSLFVVDRLSYHNGDWAAYVNYNDNRSQILDFQSVLQHEDQSYFDELGLSEDMVYSLYSWQFNDTEIFNDQVIEKMSGDSKKYNPQITVDFVFEAIGYSVEKICKIYYFAFGVLFLAAITIKRNKSKEGTLYLFISPWIMILPLFLEIGAYYFLNRGIDRVFRATGLGFWCGIILLFCCDYFDKSYAELSERKWISVFALMLLVVGIVCQMDSLKQVESFNLVNKEKVENELSYIDDGRIYMCDIKAVRVLEEEYGVWQIPPKGQFYNCIELGGWMVNYPSVVEKQKRLGVENPYRSLGYDNNVYLLTTEDGSVQLDYLRSAYDRNIESELIEKHGELSVYKYGVK